MQLEKNPNFHLTYCTNIHPGERWSEVLDQLRMNLPKLKKRLSPDLPFGIGLRLSAQAAEQLLEKNKLREFKNWLDREGLYVFTMNGFPYGGFHHRRVKDRVYAPDWRTDDRVGYTLNLAKILAELLPEGQEGGISTSPISYKPWLKSDLDRKEAFRIGSLNVARVAMEMAKIENESGRILHLDIEPEPDCLIENTRETIEFFNDWLLRTGSEFLSEENGFSNSIAEDILRRHIRVCYDTCHFAVEYEEPEQAVEQFREHGIQIGKVQISAALKLELGDGTVHREALGVRLQDFEESTYLHQVIERRTDGSMHHYGDLSEALPNIQNADAREWRIHYHVPIFMDEFDLLNSTQNDILQSLESLLMDDSCTHYEIETYTWEVLPDDLKADVLDSIEREFRWVLDTVESIYSNT